MWPFDIPGASKLLYMGDNLRVAKQLSQHSDPALASAAAHAFTACKNVCESYYSSDHKDCWTTSYDLIEASRGLLRTMQDLSMGHARDNDNTASDAIPHPTSQSLHDKVEELLDARDRTATLILPTNLPLQRIASYNFTEKPTLLGKRRETNATFFEGGDVLWLPTYDGVRSTDGRKGP